MIKEFSTHFGRLRKVSTGIPSESVKYPPPLITQTFEVVALIADSETIKFFKSALMILTKSGKSKLELFDVNLKDTCEMFEGSCEVNDSHTVEFTGNIVQGLK